MIRFSKFVMVLAFSLPVLGLVACATDGTKPYSDTALVWRPTNNLKDLTATNPGALHATVQIEKFTDGRTVNPKNEVGVNQENATAIPVTTSSDVMAFVSSNLSNTLKKGGLDVVESGGDYVLTGEVLDFMVTETNTYQGNLNVRVQLKKGSKVVWKGVISGTASRFGRSYKLDNYMEVLSDSVMDFAVSLMKNMDLREQLK